MAQKKEKSHRFWRTCRIAFRRFRISVWIVILILLSSLLYVNQIGLPGFIKRPLIERLQSRGLELEFTRMRWRWHHGIVAENVRFVRADGETAPTFFVREAQVQLDYRALARLQLQVRGLLLRDGDLTWNLAESDGPDRRISLEQIQTVLRLLPDDRWELNDFQAQFAGARIQLGGVVTNASALRHWRPLHKHTPAQPGDVERRLRQLADTLERIHFASPPDLHLDVRGDALDRQSFTVRLNVNTPDAETPWGVVQQAFLSVVMLPAESNVLSRAELALEASHASTPWAAATNLNLRVNLVSTAADTNVIEAEARLSASTLATRWGNAENARLTGHWQQSLTNALPLSGRGELRVDATRTQWGDAAGLRLAADFQRPSQPSAAPDIGVDAAWWPHLASITANWQADLEKLDSPRLRVDRLSCAGDWRAPNFNVSRIAADLYDGGLSAQATVNVASRLFLFTGNSDFDAQRISPLLTAKSREWLGQFTWNFPPRLEASGSLLLPAWTNFAHADWHGAVRPSIRLNGYFDVGDGSFRGVRFSSAHSHFSYSNLFWRLPDLVARRAEGELRLAHISNEATRDYHFRIHSTIDPVALKPLLATNQLRIYDVLGFSQPPVIDGEIRGRWYDHESIGAAARIAATNFTIHGQAFDFALGRVEYTNLFVRVIEPRAGRGTEHGSAASVDIDIAARKIYLTNAVGVGDPLVVARAVGPHIGQLMEPYRFLKPVNARVEGIIPMHHERDADLRFVLEGGPFEWWKFRLPRIAGRVHWRGEHLALEGLSADFYRGSATGDASFDFSNPHAPRYRFDVLANDADLHQLMNDLSDRTNHLEGRLTGRLTIKDAVGDNFRTLQGSGRAELRDGLIWDIPIFGVLSPVLDAIVPNMGLGSSRAREGSATFIITNGVAYSDDLEIKASMMRLQYWGTVDLQDSRVDARAQAELLRDTWIVGKLLSLTLWPVSKIFEYRFTGTLNEPRSEPVFFVPRVLLLPFHPFRSLKESGPDNTPMSGNSSGNP